MDLGCSPVTPRCRRRTQTHYSSPPARPIALRSGIRRRKSGCTGPRRLGTIGNPLNKRKVPSQGCFFFQEKGQTLAYAFTRGWRAMAAMHHAQTPAIRFAPSTSRCVWALLLAPVCTLEVKTDGVQVVPPLLGSEVDILRILRMGNLAKIKFRSELNWSWVIWP